MSNLFKSKFLLGVMVVAFMVVGFAAFATPASADCTITQTLRVGSVGIEVQCLQGKVGATADGKFGPMTMAAVKAFQASKGLSADGVVGPITRAALNGVVVVTPGNGCQPGWLFNPATGVACTSTPPGTPTTPPSGLEGGAGSISDADFVSGLTGEEVGEGAEDVEVAGLDIEADDGSDLRLTAVRLDFSFGNADQDFEDYASEVSLWFDGEEVARVDADVFTDDNNYDKTISLDGDAVIDAGDTGKLVVAVSGVNNLDTQDVTDTWTVEFESVRYEDASGAIMTDNSTGDINGVTRTFSFESFATSTDTTLKIALKTGSAADAINEAHIIDVHATESTNDVKLLAFTLKAEGDSDLEIREFLTNVVVTGATQIDSVIKGTTTPAARLIIDGEEYGTASYIDADGINVGTAEEIFFDDVNYTLDAGDTVDAYIEVDLNDTSGTTDPGDDLDEGDTIRAEITGTQYAALSDIDVRDETGTQLVTADFSGTAVGEASAVYNVGFNLELVSTSATKSYTSETAGVGDKGTFVITYKVTAVDGDIYLDNTCVEDNNGSEVATATSYSVSNDGSNTTSCIVTSSGTTSGTAFLIEEDTTDTITLTVQVVATADSSAYVSLEAIGWDDAADGDDNVFDFSLPDDFKTNPVFLDLY